jgi:integrase/recombinase XerD
MYAADHLQMNINTCSYNHTLMFPILIRLLYSSGLRISEALNLRFVDVDFERGNLMIWESKNHVSRMVTLSTSMKNVLDSYRTKMNYAFETDLLFQGYDGQPYSYQTVLYVFHQVLNNAGIPYRPSGKLPRIHDLRHVFSIRALEQMHEKGYDLYTSLPLLTKYLGHRSVTETEHYVRLTKSSYCKITEAVSQNLIHLIPEVDNE